MMKPCLAIVATLLVGLVSTTTAQTVPSPAPEPDPTAQGKAPFVPLTLLSTPAGHGAPIPTLAVGGFPIPPSIPLVRADQVRFRRPDGTEIRGSARISAPRTPANGRPSRARWITIGVPTTEIPETGTIEAYLAPEGAPSAPPDTASWPTNGQSFQVGDGDAGLISQWGPGGTPLVARMELRLIDEQGTEHTFRPGEPVTEIRDGVQTRVMWHGPLGRGLEATVRFAITLGSPLAHLSVRIENPGPCPFSQPDGTAYLKDLSLRLHLAQPCAQVLDGLSNVPRPAPLVLRLENRDAAAKDYTRNLTWKIDDGGGTRTGVVHPGVISALCGAAGSVTVARRHGAFEAPNQFDVDRDRISVGLLPLGGAGPPYTGKSGSPADTHLVEPRAKSAFRLEGGRWKTFDLGVLLLPDPVPDPSLLTELVRTLESPPRLTAPPIFMAEGGSGVLFAPLETRSKDPSIQRWAKMMTILVDDGAADPIKGLGAIGLPALIRRGGTYNGANPYGWHNFGDIPWANGFCSLHYDMVRTQMIGWMASGDRRFLDQGSVMAAHQRDIDMVHTRPPDQFAGGQRFEKGWFHGNYYIPVQSHHWVTGLYLHHVLTGDPGSRETVEQAAHYLMSINTHQWNGLYGARMLGWPLDNLISCWMLLGDPALLERARRTIDRFEELEQAAGGLGYHVNQRATDRGNPPMMTCWQHAIVLQGICRYVMESGDREPLGLARRMARHLVENQVVRGTEGRPAYVMEEWGPSGHRTRPSIHLSWFVQDALSHIAWLTKDAELWEVARELFDSAVRFHQARPGEGRLENGGTWSPIAARMLMYPGTESKILGQLGRFGTAHPWIRQHWIP